MTATKAERPALPRDAAGEPREDVELADANSFSDTAPTSRIQLAGLAVLIGAVDPALLVAAFAFVAVGVSQ